MEEDSVLQWRRRKRRKRLMFALLCAFIALGCAVLWSLPAENTSGTSFPTLSSSSKAPSETVKGISLAPPETHSPSEEKCDIPGCDILQWLNDARRDQTPCPDNHQAQAGRDLLWEDALEELAQEQAHFLATVGYLSHHTPDSPLGASLENRLKGYDYQLAGETLYRGSERSNQVVQWWLQSSHHCHVLMDPELQAVGVGTSQTVDGVFWVAIFSD